MMPNVSCLRSAMRALFARPVVADVALLKGLTWLRVGITLLLAGIFALSVAFAWSVVCPHDHGPCADKAFIPMYFQWLREFSLSLFPPMLALTVADNLRLRTLGRTATLVMGFVVGVLIAWSLHLVVDFGNPLALSYHDLINSIPNGIISPVLNSGWIALVYFKRRRDLEIAAALHEAGLTRVDLHKRTLESNLQAMQARVEPRFLLNTLRSVGLLYETDFVIADRMLDHLITYLRAALPQMRSTTSTLGTELELVRAYLGIQQIRADGMLEFAIDVPEDVLDVAFTPMLLLPFVENTLRHGTDAAGERRQLRLSVGAGDAHLTVALADSCMAKHAEETAEGLHSRLAALYGNEATLVLRPQKRGTETVMTIPFARAKPADGDQRSGRRLLQPLQDTQLTH